MCFLLFSDQYSGDYCGNTLPIAELQKAQICTRSELSRNWQKVQKMGSFLPKFIIKVSMTATEVIRKG